MRTEVGTVETQSVGFHGLRFERYYVQDWPASSFGYLEKIALVIVRALHGALQRGYYDITRVLLYMIRS